jgi:hypothetical protein
MTVALQSKVSSLEPGKPSVVERLHTLVSSGCQGPLARIAGLVVLYSLPPLLFLRNFRVVDPDIWWHLATGRWILQQHRLPTTDPFSSYGMGKLWIAYSWLFDIVIEGLYRTFGYVGVVMYDAAVRLAVAVALFHLVRSLLPCFWRAMALTGASLYVMTYVLGPRPGMLTIVFSIIELDILLSVRRTAATNKLWLLPFLLVIWANWHIQFVYGLIILGVFACEPLLNRLRPSKLEQEDLLPVRQAWIVMIASLLATLVNPHGALLYSTVSQYLHQPQVFRLVDELRAMSFREPQHFVVAFLALGAAMAIGWRRDTRLLWPILLAFASIVALRSVKEVWFLAAISACAIADGWRLQKPILEPGDAGVRQRLIVVLWVTALLAVTYRRYDVSNSWLEMQVAGNFPEVASQYIEKHRLSGPLFNDFNWGGFLIWRLPQLPVAMDGRTNVQGDDRVAHSSAVWHGKPEWATDPELRRANVVLAKKDTALASLLRLDPKFKIVYEDEQALVFQPR